MLRLVALVVVLLAVALVATLRPRLAARSLATVWHWVLRGTGVPRNAEPDWVDYYLRDLPVEAMPPEARALEEWVRTLGSVLLVLPVFLFLALFVLAP